MQTDEDVVHLNALAITSKNSYLDQSSPDHMARIAGGSGSVSGHDDDTERAS